ncbi:hypothetical protein G6F62_015782 [Rhizopus arrhizus]|nr:hypothetical protein G6F22_020061 [Rhizopus arrhizus]KAG1303693.1 hypothetical protein G6F62_015782 [Rhizopus arrhizus]
MVSAAATGITPPRPSPPMNRNVANQAGVGAQAAPIIVSENRLTQASSMRRRPSRSLSVPTANEPRNMPANA